MTISYLPLLAPEQYHQLDEAGRDADVAAVINAARTLHVDGGELAHMLDWHITRILGRNAPRVLAEIGDQLVQVARFEDEAAGYGDPDGTYDPDERAAAFRSSAWATARKAVRG